MCLPAAQAHRFTCSVSTGIASVLARSSTGQRLRLCKRTPIMPRRSRSWSETDENLHGQVAGQNGFDTLVRQPRWRRRWRRALRVTPNDQLLSKS
jgi:hypothetical protein